MTFNFITLGIIGGQEILIIALVILLLFGGAKIPQLMRGLGRGVKEFKDGTKGLDLDDDEDEKTSKKDKKKTEE
ncbi:MAG: twin-arginine translocase TatA/TatE family subunit [Bacteroidales bacterium]|nr:twin-arginine translocase TatA/TatE family subunit [Bacteroidales bacterium]